MKLKREHFIVLIIQITEVLGFSLILPFLPLYASELGATPLVVGLIPASFSLFQFFSSPIIGRLSDTYGRKPLLILSQLSTFISFIVLGFAHSLWLIFLSRAIDGLLGSNFTLAQAYLSDTSTKKDRSKIFAISGVAFSIGFLIGPAIGGYLSRFNYSLAAFLAAFISFISIILTHFFLKETVTVKKEFKFSFRQIIDTSAFSRYFADPKIRSKLLEFFSFVSTHAVWTGSMPLFASIKFGLSADLIGYGLAYVGFINIIFRTVLFKFFIGHFGEKNMKIFGLFSVLISFLLLSLLNNPWLLLLVFTLFAFGGSFVRPILSADISRSVSRQEQGTILGVSSSLQSISQVLGPILGGFLLTNFTPNSLGYVSAVIISFAIFLILKNQKTVANRL
ncbi:MFS transporter [Patescibacteria group bacterium]|nr:MFS transporter [Patescibacteria group bacterium]